MNIENVEMNGMSMGSVAIKKIQPKFKKVEFVVTVRRKECEGCGCNDEENKENDLSAYQAEINILTDIKLEYMKTEGLIESSKGWEKFIGVKLL